MACWPPFPSARNSCQTLSKQLNFPTHEKPTTGLMSLLVVVAVKLLVDSVMPQRLCVLPELEAERQTGAPLCAQMPRGTARALLPPFFAAW